MLRRYVHGSDASADDPMIWYEGSGYGEPRWLLTDERGSITAISKLNAGTPQLLAINRYDEYGIPQPANQGRFQYTGQAWLPELGMYYYKARMYSPTMGRFMQTDPIGYADGANWHAYAHGDPVNGNDPSGLCADGEIDIHNTARTRIQECVSDGSGGGGSGSGLMGSGAFGGGAGAAVSGGSYVTTFGSSSSDAAGAITITATVTRWVSNVSLSNIRIYSGYFHPFDFDVAQDQSPQSGKGPICRLLSKLPSGDSLSLGGDVQAYGGIGGYLGISAFVDREGNVGVNATRGWGAGFGGNGGVSLNYGSAPSPGRTGVSHIQGGTGFGYIGGSASYSKAEGWNRSGGLSVGPRIGFAFGSVDGTSSTLNLGNICK